MSLLRQDLDYVITSRTDFRSRAKLSCRRSICPSAPSHPRVRPAPDRSEEHTSELQSRLHLVCRLLLEKKKNVYDHTRRLPYLSVRSEHRPRPAHRKPC